VSRRNEGPRLKWHRYGAAFYICWTENGRSRERSTGTASREEAEIVFAQWLQLRRQSTGPSDPAQILVTDVLLDYANERGPKLVGQETLSRIIEILAKLWEGKTVAEAPFFVDAYVKKRDRATGTMRRELGVLQTAINYAHKRGKLTRTISIELPAPSSAKERWLTKQEAARLIKASRTKEARLYMPLFILIGLYTGRRKEAILSLRWSQIDLENRTINFEVAGRARTKKRRGLIPIPDRLLPHLIRARRRGTDLGPVLHVSGKPIQNIKKGFAAACRRAGIEGVTPHTLRHTAITWACKSGADLWELSGFFAVSMKILTAVYGHHHPTFMREAANSVAKAFRRISA
jgi:integrase